MVGLCTPSPIHLRLANRICARINSLLQLNAACPPCRVKDEGRATVRTTRVSEALDMYLDIKYLDVKEVNR